MVWACGPVSFDLSKRCHVIGTLNVNSGSFFAFGIEAAVKRGIEMAAEGADIIEVGGESARPGSKGVLVQQELDSIVPVIRALFEAGLPVAIDTTRARVARAALEAGASIVNDVSMFRSDPEMAPLLRDSDCGVVVLHSNSPNDPALPGTYKNVGVDVADYLKSEVLALEEEGFDPRRLAIDPGLGFAKNRQQCLEVLNDLPRLVSMGYPVMIAASRKSFIGRTLNIPPRKRLAGTAAVVAWSVAQGATLIRVHDVKQMSRVVKMTEAIKSSSL